MFNFKKIKEAVTELTSIVLTATLSVGMFSATPVKATTGINKRIVLVGNEGSGKAGIMDRMVNNKFEEERDRIVTGFFKKTYEFNGNEYIFNFQDVCDENTIDLHIKKSDAIILAVAYDDDNLENSVKIWLDYVNKRVNGPTPLKIVITKSDIQDEDKKITDGRAKKCDFDGRDYPNLRISESLIETSAKNDIGIRYKENEKMDSIHCLEDYLLEELFNLQRQPSNTEDTKQVHSNTNQSQPKTNSFGKNNNKGQSIFQKSKGFVKKHSVISFGALVTVVTPLVVFRNKIIKGIESIFGKKQIKKPIAKRIKITN